MATETAQTYKISFKFDESFKRLEAFQKKFKQGSVDQMKALDRAKASVGRMAIMQDKAATAAHRGVQAAIKHAIATATSADELRDVVARQRAILKASKQVTNEIKKQNFLMQKMKSSSKQIAGNWLSAFAVAGAVTSTVTLGQDMQSVESTLLSVSDDSKDAANQLKFVRKEAFRLGGDLRSTAKDYSKLLAASKNQISKKQTQELFTGLMEASTVLGLSADDSTGALRALSQMLGKTKITAEELRQQLGDRMPRAIPLMAQAAQDAGLIGKKVPKGQLINAMNELMENGKLISKDILPAFTAQLRAFAAPGLEKALKSNRVAMNRLKFSMQDAQNQVFTGKFEEGLTELFQSLGTFFEENESLWKTIGKVLGSLFKGLTIGVKILTPIITVLGNMMNGLTEAFGDFAAVLILLMKPSIFGAVLTGFKSLFALMRGKSLSSLVMMTTQFGLLAIAIAASVGLLEEMANLVAGNDVAGVFFNTKEQIADRKKGGNTSTALSRLGQVTPYFGPLGLGVDTVVKVINIIDGEVVAESVAKSATMDTVIENKQFSTGVP